jgi:hypothetical protein
MSGRIRRNAHIIRRVTQSCLNKGNHGPRDSAEFRSQIQFGVARAVIALVQA